MPLTQRIGTRFVAHRSGVSLRYLLRATFDAPDQGYDNGQVLDTVAEGVQDGQLTVVEVDGTLAIVSGRCAFTAQATPTWGDLGFYSQATTRALGRGLLATVNLSTWEEMGLCWHSAAAVAQPSTTKYALQANATDGRLDNTGGVAIATGLSLSTNYKLALILGGYDVNGVAWRGGQAAGDYLYGAALYYHNGTNWVLLWRNSADNTATLYAMFSALDGVGIIELPSGVPDADLSAVLQPTCLSTFTAANGTSLDAITPEVGGAWTEESGDWNIQGNKATVDGAPSVKRAIIDAGIANCVVDVISNTGSSSSDYVGLVLRHEDPTHHWLLRTDTANDTFDLYEIDTSSTLRAQAAVTVDVNTDYNLRATLDGQTISGFLNGGNKISYASASFQETSTKFGVFCYSEAVTDPTFDNFAIFPRTSSVYDAVLGGV